MRTLCLLFGVFLTYQSVLADDFPHYRFLNKQLMNTPTLVTGTRNAAYTVHSDKEDKIYVLERGNIVESGKHEELLELKGLYYAMWRQQIGERELVTDGLLKNVSEN